jgi:hypothetical protein
MKEGLSMHPEHAYHYFWIKPLVEAVFAIAFLGVFFCISKSLRRIADKVAPMEKKPE